MSILFESDREDSFIRNFALSGRLQGDLAWVDADQGDFDDELWRRFRFGFKSKLANDWVVQLEGDFDLNMEDDEFSTASPMLTWAGIPVMRWTCAC